MSEKANALLPFSSFVVNPASLHCRLRPNKNVAPAVLVKLMPQQRRTKRSYVSASIGSIQLILRNSNPN
jgi:hypothetical protein